MHWIFTILLSIWTLYIGAKVSQGIWDAIILMCWITWPLYLCSILALAKHRSQKTSFWRLRMFSDYLLLGAFLPLVFGVAIFNIKLGNNLQSETISTTQNLLFVGYSSVVLWGVTAISVFLFYLASKVFLKRAP